MLKCVTFAVVVNREFDCSDTVWTTTSTCRHIKWRLIAISESRISDLISTRFRAQRKAAFVQRAPLKWLRVIYGTLQFDHLTDVVCGSRQSFTRPPEPVNVVCGWWTKPVRLSQRAVSFATHLNRLILINRPGRDERLSRTWCRVAAAEVRTAGTFAIAKSDTLPPPLVGIVMSRPVGLGHKALMAAVCPYSIYVCHKPDHNRQWKSITS